MIEVIVPWRGGCPHRERAWEHVRELYPTEWKLTVASPPEGPWVKALAVNPAIRSSSAGIIIVADADCWTDGLERAVEAVRSGASWAVPHKGVVRLSERGSEAVYRGEPWEGQPLAERPYGGVIGGGFVVAHREVLLSVPMDPRFKGWGQEDHSWGLALHTLAGRPWRGMAHLVHFWHPPQERLARKWGSKESKALFHRYHAAANKPDQMRSLLHEFASTDQPASDDHRP